MAVGDGVRVEDIVVANGHPVPIIARHIMTWLGWI
jgi:hypothetical protein